MLKLSTSDTVKLTLACIAAAWLIYTFYLTDNWDPKPVNLDAVNMV